MHDGMTRSDALSGVILCSFMPQDTTRLQELCQGQTVLAGADIAIRRHRNSRELFACSLD